MLGRSHLSCITMCHILFAVLDLNVVPVGNYQDIQLWMSQGEKQRTIASTKMNETSR